MQESWLLSYRRSVAQRGSDSRVQFSLLCDALLDDALLCDVRWLGALLDDAQGPDARWRRKASSSADPSRLDASDDDRPNHDHNRAAMPPHE